MLTTTFLPREFRDLYEDRLAEEFPECSWDEVGSMLEEGESVSAHFGSTGYTVYPGMINHSAHFTIFMRGYCVLFAYLYAEKAGTDQFLLFSKKDSPDWEGHILVVSDRPGDPYLDAEGAHSIESVQRSYPPESYTYEIVSTSKLWELGILDRNQHSHPLEFLDPFEQGFTRLFVDDIFRQLGA